MRFTTIINKKMSNDEIKREQQIAILTNKVFDRYARKGVLLDEHVIRMVQNHIWTLYASGKIKQAKLFAYSCKLGLSKKLEVMA